VNSIATHKITDNSTRTVNIWTNSAQSCHAISRHKQNTVTSQIIKTRNMTTGSSNYSRYLNNNHHRHHYPSTAQSDAGKSSLSSRPQASDIRVANHLCVRLSCRQTRKNLNLRISKLRSVNSVKMSLSKTVCRMNRAKH